MTARITRLPVRRFTLIELLVVIAIMAVLIAMLLPALARARETARSAGCVNNQKQMALATMMYADEWGDAVVPAYNGDGQHFYTMLGEYMGLTYPDSRSPLFTCPSQATQAGWVEHPQLYACNGAIMTQIQYMKDQRITGFLKPADLMLYGDKAPWWGWGDGGYTFNQPHSWFTWWWDYDATKGQAYLPAYHWTFAELEWAPYFRHGSFQVCNFAFADGHVEGMRNGNVRALNIHNRW